MIVRPALLAASATPSPSPSSSTPSGEGAKAGPIGLAVILLLCIACYFLFKSMSKHLRTVRERFPSEAGYPGDPLRVADPGPPPTPVSTRTVDGSGDEAARPAEPPAPA